MMKKRFDYMYLMVATVLMCIHLLLPEVILSIRITRTDFSIYEGHVLILLLVTVLSVVFDIVFRKNEQSYIQKYTLLWFTALLGFSFGFMVMSQGANNPGFLPLTWLPLLCVFIYTLIIFKKENIKVIVTLKYGFYTLLLLVNVITYFVALITASYYP